MVETTSMALSIPNYIFEDANLMLPMEIVNKTDLILEAMKGFVEENKSKSLKERLKEGYREMSQINLSLAEIGIEQDNLDLRYYEARITGCDIL